MFKYGFRERIRGGIKMDNKMKEVAKMLGVKLGEEFEVKTREGVKYKFTEKGLEIKTYCGYSNSYTLGKLIRGELTIKWTPKSGNKYYFVFSRYPKPMRLLYYNESMADRLMLKRGMITRTEEEATEKMKDMGWLEE